MTKEALICPGKEIVLNVLEVGGQDAFRNIHGGGRAHRLRFVVCYTDTQRTSQTK